METIRQTRRRFIATLIGLPLVLGGLWRFLTPKATVSEALVRVPLSSVPENGAVVFRQQRIAVMREGASIAALSLVCTHLGCTVSVTPDGMVCPCHGSRFDRQGVVLTGPAQRPLPRLQTELDGDHVVVRS